MILACARCGEGPILTGVLAADFDRREAEDVGAGLATALRGWLVYRGWRVTPELLYPHDQT
ncbi:MAG: hypothetical protein ACRDRU_24595 [Pseudonocardiaceae bacterium]